jgi:hypothetical protein
MTHEELRSRIEKMLIMLDKKIETAKMKVEKLCETTGCFEELCNDNKKTTQSNGVDDRAG